MPGVIVDDSELLQSAFRLTPSNRWIIQTGAQGAYNSTITLCDPANGTTTSQPKLSYSFTGTEISIVGRPTADLRMNYSIDDTSVRPASLNTSQSVVGKDGVVIWKLDRLEPRSHTIELFPVQGRFLLDYLTYLPSSISPSSRDSVLLDDQDPQIKYTGTWNTATNFQTPAGFPFNGTVSRTKTAGSSFEISFIGSAIGIYVLRNSQAGKLSASYRLDNDTAVDVTLFNGSQPVQDRWDVNFLPQPITFAPGRHTYTVTVKEVTDNQEFIFDYLTYEATSSSRFVTTPVPTRSTSGSSDRQGGIRINIGAIVGSIIAFMILAYCIRRLLRHRASTRITQTYTTQIRYGQGYGGQQQPYDGQNYGGRNYSDGNNRGQQDNWQPPPPPYVPPPPEQGPLQPQASGWQPPTPAPAMPTPQPWQQPPVHTAGEVSVPEPAPPPAAWSPQTPRAQPEIGAFAAPSRVSYPPPSHPPPSPHSPSQARQGGTQAPAPRSESPELEEVPLEQLGLGPAANAHSNANPNPSGNSNTLSTTTNRPSEPGGGPAPSSFFNTNINANAGPGQGPGPQNPPPPSHPS